MMDTYVTAERLSKQFHIAGEKRSLLAQVASVVAPGRNGAQRRDFWALKDLSFTVNKGDKLAIVGQNGSGKTTLLRLLGGVYEKYEGRLTVCGDPHVLLKPSVGFLPDLSAVDNIYLFGAILGMSRAALQSKIETITTLAGIFDLRFSPVKLLSTGQVKRLALGIIFQSNHAFSIFDESLTSVDPAFMKSNEASFRDIFAPHKTVVMASHSLGFLKRHFQQAIWLEKGTLKMFGPIHDVIQAYEQSS